MQSTDEIELAVHKAFQEVLIEELSFGFGVTVLLVDGFFLGHSVIYGAHKQAHNQEKKHIFYRWARIGENEEIRMEKYFWKDFWMELAEIVLGRAW